MNKKLIVYLFGLGLYFISTGISYAVFNSFVFKGGNPVFVSPVANISPSVNPKNKVDPSLPRTAVCPMNGEKYTEKEKEDWEKRRPLAVMIENSEDARPQSGLSRADVVYEALVEGWVTRYMGVFYCNTPFENIAFAPVRSARSNYLDWVSEYDALYNHVGGANRLGDNAASTAIDADALGQIQKYGIKDLDQFGIGMPDCYRNPDRVGRPVATEHTMVCFEDNLYKIAEKRGWTNVDEDGVSWDKNFTMWKFKDGNNSDLGNVNSVKIAFSEGRPSYDVEWIFDRENNIYKRKLGGEQHIDLDNKQDLVAKNVVIQLTKIRGPVDGHGHLLYTSIGSGKALIFQDGKVINGTWSKKTRISRTQYFDSKGKEVEFTRGPIWIELVPNEDQVSY